MLWAILSLVLPVTFGHTTACRSPALVFSAAIHFAMKCSAPCSAVLRHSPSSWAAVFYTYVVANPVRGHKEVPRSTGAAALGRNPVNISTRFSLSMEMSRLTRDGTAEPVSRDQILRHERGQGNIHFFPVQYGRSTPVAQLAPRNLLTRWDVSSIPANGIFLTKN